MLILVLGSIGIGSMWGWYVGHSIGLTYISLIKALTIGLGLILLSIQISLLTNLFSCLFFLAATTTTLLIHVIWLRSLRARFGLTTDSGGIQ